MSEDEDVRTYDEPAIQEPGPAPMRWLYVFVIGLGFFTTGVSWSVYNSYLPIDFLRPFIIDMGYGAIVSTIVGAIMVLDNVFAFVMQPYISARSDKTRTKWGRRMPYIMIGTPIAALFFTLIAYGWALFGFWFMLAMITIFNVAMAFYRGPVVALMPDVVSSEQRSKANGVINLMGGVGAIYAFGVSPWLYGIDDANIGAILGVSAAQAGPVLAFMTTSIIMLISVLILFLVVKEPEVPPVDLDKPKEIGIIEAFRQVTSMADKSALAVLGAIMFWFLGFNALETWFTTYGNLILSFETNQATFLMTAFSLTFVLFAVPAGFMAGRLGRRNTILAGLVGLIAILAIAIFIADYWTLFALLGIGGFFWAMINVNSIVIVWELVGKSRLGAGTGMYYAFSMSAAIFGPLITGVIFDLTSVALLFPVSIGFLIIAFLLTLAIKTGEVGDEEVSELAA